MALSSPLRIGVMGAANVARRFIAGVSQSTYVVVTAIASRSATKAEAFAREVGVARSHGSYEALLSDPDIDAIYIPLPNSLHAAWAIRAVGGGKHVLCEKPIAVNASEAKAMFASALAHRVHLVEAYPYLSQPQTVAMRQLLREGAIGPLRLIRVNFGLNSVDLHSNPSGAPNARLVPSLGGGALLDLGSYAVSLARVAAGVRPSRVHATGIWDASGIDRTVVATLEFPGGLLAQVSCSFATGFHRHATIAGETGIIETTYLNHPPEGGPAVLGIRRGTTIADRLETIEVEEGNGFLAEANSFARLVANGPNDWSGATPVESVDVMLTLDAIRTSVQSGVWEEVGS
jgi:D-xylose 1-dehydrogenase (NADP+, D-xylono-1,5-lactone-forming)